MKFAYIIIGVSIFNSTSLASELNYSGKYGACFNVAGILEGWNGAPAIRLAIVKPDHLRGRILGIGVKLPNELSNWPFMGNDGNYQYSGEFTVCPLSAYTSNKMRSVAIQSANNISINIK
jgi:hypothetical protein